MHRHKKKGFPAFSRATGCKIKLVPLGTYRTPANICDGSCTSQRVKNMGLKGMKEPLLPEPCAPELPTDEAAYAAAAAESRPPPFNPCHDEFESVPMARTRAPERSRCERRSASPPHHAHRLLRVLFLPARHAAARVWCDCHGPPG